jgi:hypothetical protein
MHRFYWIARRATRSKPPPSIADRRFRRSPGVSHPDAGASATFDGAWQSAHHHRHEPPPWRVAL